MSSDADAKECQGRLSAEKHTEHRESLKHQLHIQTYFIKLYCVILNDIIVYIYTILLYRYIYNHVIYIYI